MNRAPGSSVIVKTACTAAVAPLFTTRNEYSTFEPGSKTTARAGESIRLK
jgi:hypothetical protein